MELNKIELKKVIYGFNSISNRLMQADRDDYLSVLKKFIAYLKSKPIISDYISGCGECDQDLEKDIQELRKAYGRAIFTTGDTEQEEVRNVFATLEYIAENNIEIQYDIAMGYSNSNKYQDKIKGFNDRFVMILIRHIENFLTQVGIEMGLDERAVYNVEVHNGQAIFTGDNANITAINNTGIDMDKLNSLIENIRKKASNITPEEEEAMNESLEVIEKEAQSNKPRKSFLKTSIKTLSAIKGTVEFAAAVASLIEFITSIL